MKIVMMRIEPTPITNTPTFTSSIRLAMAKQVFPYLQ